MLKRLSASLLLLLVASGLSGVAAGAAARERPPTRGLFSPGTQSPFPVSGVPTALGTVDFEGDNLRDLVVGTAGPDRIEVIYNDDDGISRSSSNRVDGPVAGLTAGKYGDSILVASAGSDNATFFDPKYVRIGLDVFAPGATVAVGSDPSAVTAADTWIFDETPQGQVENEQWADFIVANRGSDDLSLVGRDPETGRASVRATVPVGDAPTGLVNDRGSIWVASSGAGTVSVLDSWLRNGVMRSETVAVGGEPVAIAFGDLVTSDSRDHEIAVVDRRGGQVLLLDRPPQVVPHPFEPYRVVARYPVGKEPVAILAANLDERIGVDLAVVDSGSDDVAVLLNRSSGFVAGGRYPTGRHPVAIASVNLASRAGPNLVVANRGSRNLSILVRSYLGSCDAKPARLRIGTAAPEQLGGSKDPEESHGLGGGDYMPGGPGRDCLFGEGGNDHLLGHRDGDLIWPGPGRDEADGGSGNDVIFARGGGRDRVDCGDGDDTAYVDRLDRARRCEHRIFAG